MTPNTLNREHLNLDTPWSMGEAAFSRMIAIVHQKVPHLKTLVEFGSGKSSIRLANTFPDAQVFSIESDPFCFNQSQALAETLLTHANLTVLHQPLSFQTYGSGEILSYTPTAHWNDLTIDCVIIDGPAFYTLRGREACLYQVYDQLAIGGVVILDDYRRVSEQAIVRNWLAVYSNSFTVEIVPVGHRLAVLTKQATVVANWNHPIKQKDSRQLRQNYQRIRSTLLQWGTADRLNGLQQQGSLGHQIAQVIRAMQAGYGISEAPIEAVQLDASHSFIDRQRMYWNSLQVCLQLAYLAR
jgi:predicted O-methyltransferase YrrM